MSDVKLTLYRSGRLTPAGDYTTTNPRFLQADAVRPAGRAGRTTGLFCAPSLEEMASWHLANLQMRRAGYVAEAREIRYCGPMPYAYPVAAWDAASFTNSGEQELHDYWNSGRPAAEVLADPAAFIASNRRWHWERRIEILIDPAYIVSSRRVSDKRLVMAAEESVADRLEWALWPRRRSKGRTLRAYGNLAGA